MVGAASLPACESMKNHPPCNVTVEQLVISSTVSGEDIRVSQTVAALRARSPSRKPTLAAPPSGREGRVGPGNFTPSLSQVGSRTGAPV
jgi:hypothetical protein